jgi:hypothetical protein
MRLIDVRTSDGSRHFACLPKTCDWKKLRDHIGQLQGLEFVNLVVGRPEDPWCDFTFRGPRFLIRNGGPYYHFFVGDPQCSDLLLFQVALHCERLLGPDAAQ